VPGSLQHRRDAGPDLPGAFRGDDGSVAVYFEPAAVITVLVLLGQVLELRAREQTSGAIRALLDLAPKTARRIGATAATKEIRSNWWRSATGCASAPARRCRSTASSSRAARRRRIDGDRRIDARHQELPGRRSSAAP
jgi:hypothetical protein